MKIADIGFYYQCCLKKTSLVLDFIEWKLICLKPKFKAQYWVFIKSGHKENDNNVIIFYLCFNFVIKLYKTNKLIRRIFKARVQNPLQCSLCIAQWRKQLRKPKFATYFKHILKIIFRQWQCWYMELNANWIFYFGAIVPLITITREFISSESFKRHLNNKKVDIFITAYYYWYGLIGCLPSFVCIKAIIYLVLLLLFLYWPIYFVHWFRKVKVKLLQ